jgi:riboflavin synthase
MFTGLITRLGKMESLMRDSSGGHCMTLSHQAWDEPLALGESISVMGVCLTVVRIHHAEKFSVDVLDETLAKTGLSQKVHGACLNMERALRPMDRLGGHFVTGHVDGTGTIQSIRTQGRDKIFRIACPETLTREMVVKGSIAIDGISLTLAAVESESCEVHIIPHTISNTALNTLTPGDIVNLETDILGKYILKSGRSSGDTGLSEQSLSNAGFI